MLVLSRHVNETIVIVDTQTNETVLTLMVVRLTDSSKGGKARIGIKADKRYVVDRSEVHDKKQLERQTATNQNVDL